MTKNALITYMLFVSTLAGLTAPSHGQTPAHKNAATKTSKPLPTGKDFWQSSLAKDALELTKWLLLRPPQEITPLLQEVTPNDLAYQQGLLVDLQDSTSYRSNLAKDFFSVPTLIAEAKKQDKTHIILPAEINAEGKQVTGPQAISIADLNSLQTTVEQLGKAANGNNNNLLSLDLRNNLAQPLQVHKDFDNPKKDFKVSVSPDLLTKINLKQAKALLKHEQGHLSPAGNPPQNITLNQNIRYEMSADEHAIEETNGFDFMDGLIATSGAIDKNALATLKKPSDIGQLFKDSFSHPDLVSRVFICTAMLLAHQHGQNLTANNMWKYLEAIGQTPYPPSEETYPFDKDDTKQPTLTKPKTP